MATWKQWEKEFPEVKDIKGFSTKDAMQKRDKYVNSKLVKVPGSMRSSLKKQEEKMRKREEAATQKRLRDEFERSAGGAGVRRTKETR